MKIPNGWKPYEFGKAVSFNPKVKFQKGEQYTFIEMDDVNADDKFATGKGKRIFTTGSCSKFRNNDVLFARITPCLDNKKIATAAIGENEVGFGSTEFIILRAKENVTVQEYVHYLSKSEYIIQNAINSYVGASGRQRADAKFIKKVLIPLPRVPEQQRIASILSAYDDLIEVNNKRIALLEQMAEQIYKEWFVRMRFPGYQDAEFEKGVLKGWEVKQIKNFGKVVTGKTPSTTNSRYYGGNYPFIKTPDMHGNIFVLGTEETLTEDGFRSQKSQVLPANAISVSCIGTGGIVSITPCACMTNQQINSLILDNQKQLEFLFFTFRGLKTMIEMFGSTGATMTNLSKGKFENLKLIKPTDELIEKFHNYTHPILKSIRNLSEQQIILKKTRDLLLPRLISGKLRVKDIPEPQTVSV